jgi:phosphoribosylformylglycinamidine synthase subunit PurS
VSDGSVATTAATEVRFAVNVRPKPGILDPQGRAVEGSLGHLGIEGVHDVRVGRRIELTVTAPDEVAARAIVDRLAGELLANPLIEAWDVETLGATSSLVGAAAGGSSGSGGRAESGNGDRAS